MIIQQLTDKSVEVTKLLASTCTEIDKSYLGSGSSKNLTDRKEKFRNSSTNSNAATLL